MTDLPDAMYEGWEWWWECPHCGTATCEVCGIEVRVGN